MSAPVCHIPPENANIPQPGVRNFPAVPIATDLASALRAVNALRQIVNILAGSQGVQGANGFANNATQKNDKGTWVEQNRTTEIVKVFNPDDNTQFIEVERINSLTMNNKDTGQTWKWKR